MGITCALFVVLHIFKEKSYHTLIPAHDPVSFLIEKRPSFSLGNTPISYAISPIIADNYFEIQYFARTENFSSFSNCIVSKQPTSSDAAVCFNGNNFCLADSNLFKIIQYSFVDGSSENALSTPGSIVLSKETAVKYFGNEPALGKILTLNKEKDFTVTGVVEIPEYVTFRFSMIAPITSLRSESELQKMLLTDSNPLRIKGPVDYIKAILPPSEHVC